MKHGGRVFHKEASLVYITLNSAEKARLFPLPTVSRLFKLPQGK